MTQRNKQISQDDSPEVYEWFRQFLVEHGIGNLLKFAEPTSDGGFFIDPDIEKWFSAFEAFENGDKVALVALMKSGASIPDGVVPHLGDLIDRWDFIRPKHRMRIPSYQLTDADIAMNEMDCNVNYLVRSGKALADAIEEVAARWGIKETVLAEYHGKRRGPDRRVKARARAAKRE